MKALQGLESSLNDVFGKSAPQLPKGFKEFLVKIVPWLSLIGGILGLLSVYNIYQWVGKADDITSFGRAYGIETGLDYSWSVGLYIAVAVLLVTAILYVLAFSPLRNQAKKGWDFLFYALLLNLVSGIVMAFTDYGQVGSVVGALIGFAIGAYFLFQIRSYYTGQEKVAGASSDKTAKKN